MIEITPDTGLMLYLALTLTVILSVWISHHLSKRKQKIVLYEQRLLTCEYCLTPYMGDISKKLSHCPACKSINKHETHI